VRVTAARQRNAAQTERPDVPEPEDDTSQPPPDADQSAMDRYLEHRDRMLDYDREYLERLKHAEPAPPPARATPDLPWGHPICDSCPKRAGCGLRRVMRKVDGFKAGRSAMRKADDGA
jgi:hypothetical protein